MRTVSWHVTSPKGRPTNEEYHALWFTIEKVMSSVYNQYATTWSYEMNACNQQGNMF